MRIEQKARPTPRFADVASSPWRLLVCGAVGAFLALGAATHTFRVYHLFLLLAVPFALFSADAGRRFFVDWWPLLATWIAYDRLRLVQPYLLSRVAVAWPYDLERALFGRFASGEAPPHAARAWLAAHAASSPFWAGVALELQFVYLAHLFAYPLLFGVWWWRGRRDAAVRTRFREHVAGAGIANTIALVGYLLVPAAPPWWVSLYGTARPTAALVASADLSAAMDGALIQRTLATAPDWFAAIPSLHGALPVLLFLLGLREGRRGWIAAVAVWGVVMWTATVALNQHYVVDLLAGALVAVAAYAIVGRLGPGAGAHGRPGR